jgi:hypothetical protein
MVNVIRINGKIIYDLGEELPQLEFEPVEALKIEKFLGHLKRNKRAYMGMAYGLAVLLMPGNALAASGMSGGMNLILLLQKASFWVGMGVTIWGLIEMGLDAPGWRGRVLKGVFMYIGVLLVPLVFLELQNSLQVDVWEQIKNGTREVGTTP